MKQAALAGLLYCALVFALGFVLGSVRVLLVAPTMGEFSAVLIELPVMMLACWLVSGRLVSQLRISTLQAALVMGVVAFSCLMVAEFSLGALAFERTIADQLQHWATPAGALGLGGQIAFAVFPWIHVRRAPSN